MLRMEQAANPLPERELAERAVAEVRAEVLDRVPEADSLTERVRLRPRPTQRSLVHDPRELDAGQPDLLCRPGEAEVAVEEDVAAAIREVRTADLPPAEHSTKAP